MGAEQSTPAEAAAQPAAAKTGPTPSALVLCGPSGVGKGTLIKRLLESAGGTKYAFSVSHTTRKPRPGEVDGMHYYFTSREQMEADVAAGQFLETAQVHGNMYGTSKAAVQDTLAAGKVALLDVDVQGARQIRAARVPALFVFIAPPSLEELERRLRGRGTETPNTMGARMRAARTEISSLNERGLFDYLLLNEDLDATAAELERIAQRALAGLPAEPGQVPDEVRFEDDEEGGEDGGGGGEGGADAAAAAAAAAERVNSGTAASTSNAAAAAAAGLAAAALPLGSSHISSTPRAADEAPPSALAGGGATAAAAAAASAAAAAGGRTVLGEPGPAAPPAAPPAAALAGVAEGLAAWHGKVAVVTGASSGIGWAVCEALGRAGLRVVAVARRRERLAELQGVMEAAAGAAPGSFLPVVADVTKEAEVNALPSIIAAHWPGAGIDALFNNAGLSRNGSSLFDGRVENWLEMVSTNILGTAMMTRVALQDMQRRGSWGHIIINVGLSGHRIPDAAAGGTFFAATKSAVKTLTEGLRQEARAKGLPLRVSGISPGLVQTEFFTVRAFGDAGAARAAVGSVQQPLQPADVASAVVWCLAAPPHMEVNDIVIRPTQQAL